MPNVDPENISKRWPENGETESASHPEIEFEFDYILVYNSTNLKLTVKSKNECFRGPIVIKSHCFLR